MLEVVVVAEVVVLNRGFAAAGVAEDVVVVEVVVADVLLNKAGAVVPGTEAFSADPKRPVGTVVVAVVAGAAVVGTDDVLAGVDVGGLLPNIVEGVACAALANRPLLGVVGEPNNPGVLGVVLVTLVVVVAAMPKRLEPPTGLPNKVPPEVVTAVVVVGVVLVVAAKLKPEALLGAGAGNVSVPVVVTVVTNFFRLRLVAP